MSFIANAKTSPEPAMVGNDGWFPDIDLSHMRDNMRLDGTVTTERLIQAVEAAILNVNQELDEWQDLQLEEHYSSLEAVPATKINGLSKLFILYRRAVYSCAKADLIERYRDYDTTASSLADKKSMEWLNEAPSEQRRNSHWAIADIMKRSRMTVELI